MSFPSFAYAGALPAPACFAFVPQGLAGFFAPVASLGYRLCRGHKAFLLRAVCCASAALALLPYFMA
ncbi:hypothetical protein DWUX_2041 [Desulfovibrio diazotrophicus]|nr:hypothetical protein DWUX_2041 [Desulfovibrio diazotrophicus]